MKINPETGDVSVVLLGNFNPVIFKPEWFEKFEVLSEEDANKCKVKVIHPEITEFQNDWLKLQVTPNRFYAESTEHPFIRVHDFVVNTFKNHLSHTPVSTLGINRQVHFSAGTVDARDRVGKILAPREPWGEWGKLIDEGKEEKHGGMISLTMQIQKTDDREKGFINITVRPSTKVFAGIFADINDQYELSDKDESLGSDRIIEILEDRFNASIERSEKIIDQIMGLV